MAIFAEFLNNASSVGLRILSSSTCVGLRYGTMYHNSGFFLTASSWLRYFNFAPRHVFRLNKAFGSFSSLPCTGFSIPAPALCLCPHISDTLQYRNFNLLSIDYVFRPRLRSRLHPGQISFALETVRYSAVRFSPLSLPFRHLFLTLLLLSVQSQM